MEYILTSQDLQQIKSAALDYWKERLTREDTSMTECYTKAFIYFCTINNITLKTGKLYKDE